MELEKVGENYTGQMVLYMKAISLKIFNIIMAD
jgi:hypothetical protein